MIRVMIVDDNPVIRRGVAALLEEADDIRLVGEAGDGRAAIHVAGEAKPDVVLLDVRMPVMDGVEAAGPLAERARVMMLTYTDDQERVVAAIRAGAAGYLVHGQFDADELATRIRQLAANETVFSPAIVGTVFEALRKTPRSPDEADGLASLTEREREIMNLISQGLTNRDIAEQFVLSEEDGQEPRQPHLLQARRHQPRAGDRAVARHRPAVGGIRDSPGGPEKIGPFGPAQMGLPTLVRRGGVI